MKASRLNARTILLLLVEAMLLFSGLIVAVYVRLGAIDAEDALIVRHGFYKAALATIFCLTSFYLFDLYDFIVMHDRGELVLRLLQALGLAWIALALLFYVVPQVMIGRGVSFIALPIAHASSGCIVAVQLNFPTALSSTSQKLRSIRFRCRHWPCASLIQIMTGALSDMSLNRASE